MDVPKNKEIDGSKNKEMDGSKNKEMDDSVTSISEDFPDFNRQIFQLNFLFRKI